jgi:hypothetical protein
MTKRQSENSGLTAIEFNFSVADQEESIVFDEIADLAHVPE